MAMGIDAVASDGVEDFWDMTSLKKVKNYEREFGNCVKNKLIANLIP